MTSDNPLAGFLDDLDAEETAEQARIEALLEPYRDSRDASNLYGKMAGEYGEQIKSWMQLNPDVEVADPEHGLTARLQTRRLPGHFYDLVAIIENNPALFARLVSTRALRIDHAAALAADLGGEIKPYAIPSGETTALIVERNK